MDEKQIQLIDKLLADGRDAGYIHTRLKMQGVEIDKGQLQSYIGSKQTTEKKNFSITGLSTPQELEPVGGVSVSEEQPSPSALGDDLQKQYENSLALDWRRSDPIQSDYIESIGGEDAYVSSSMEPYFRTAEWELSGLDIFDIAAQAKSSVKAISNQDIASEINKNEEYLKELREVQKKYAPGNVVEVPNYEKTDFFGKTPVEEVTSTTEELNKQIESLRKKYAGQAFASKIEEVGKEILESLPEGIRKNPDALKAITDRVYKLSGLNRNTPINLNLDGDGVINEQPLVMEWMDAFSDGVSDIPMGVIKLGMSTAIEAFQGTEAAKEWAEGVAETDQNISLQRTTYDSGAIESFQSGDWGNGFRQISTQVVGGIPSVATAMLPGGVVIMGTSGAGSANVEALSNPEFTGAGRAKYVLTSGVSDAISAKLNKWIFNGAAKKAAQQSAELGFKQALTNKKHLTDLVKAEFTLRGQAATAEYVEEYAVAVAQDWARTTGQGESWEFDFWNPEYHEAGIVGGALGTGVSFAGSIKGKADIASRARADKVASEAAKLEAEAEQLESAAEESVGDVERSLRAQAQAARDRASELRTSRKKYYEVVQLRNEQLFSRYQEIDAEVNEISRQLENSKTPDSAKPALEARLNELIKNRIKLDDGFSRESMSFTDNERATLLNSSSETYLNNISEELAEARATLKELESKKKPSKKAVDSSKQGIKDLVNKRRRFQRLQKKHEALVEERNNTDEEADPDTYQDIEDQIDNTVNRIAQLTEMPVDTWGGLSTGDYLTIVDEVNDRYTSQWTQEAIEGMDNSELSREAIEAILTSDNFAMLTGENPNAQAVSNARNTRFNARAERFLLQKGLNYHKIVGRYGAGENSYLVEGMTREQAAEFASLMGQESVAHKDGLVQADGSIQLFDGKGPSFIDSIDGDFFSAMKDTEGNNVAWQFGLSDSFQDSDGKKITEKDYNKRAEDVQIDISEIEAMIEEENLAGKDPGVAEETLEGDGYVSVPRMSTDGSPNVKVGDGGIESADEARAVNNMQRLLDKIFGGKVEIRLYTDAGSAKAVSNITGWGGLWKGGVIHINANQIRSNALYESVEGQRTKTKTFQETLQEEVMHAIIGNSLTNFFKNHTSAARKLENTLLKIAGRSNVEGFKERLEDKRKSYGGPTDPKVFEEVVIEFMSTIAANPDINLGLLSNVVIGFNNMLSALGGNKVAKGFKISNAAQVMEIAKRFADAQAKGETFEFDVEGSSLSPDSEDAASARLVNPTRIPANEDGKVVISMGKPIYRWLRGVKKDIGTETITKEFNDVWHFINWWRKATDNGENLNYYGFKTVDGDSIDVDRIKEYGTRASARLNVQDRISDMIDEAVDQKVVPRVVAQRARKRLKAAVTKLSRQEMLKGKDSEGYRSIDEAINKYEGYLYNFFNEAAKRAGKEFTYDQDNERASHRLRVHLFSSMGLDGYYLSREEKNRLVQSLTGKKLGKKAGRIQEELLMREAISKIPGTVQDKLEFLASYYLGSDSKTIIDKTFNGENPIEYFSNYHNEAESLVSDLINQGRLSGSLDDNLMRLHFIMAFTSAQNRSTPNVNVAIQILELANKDRNKRGGHEILGSAMINALTKRGKIEGFDRKNLIPGHTLTGSRRSFEKLEALINGDVSRFADIPVVVKDALIRATGSRGNFIDDDGNVMWGDVMKFLLSPYEGSRVKKKGMVMSQMLFSPKLGAWALNLSQNSMPDLRAGGIGLADVVTIDTHVMSSMSILMDKNNNYEQEIQKGVEELGYYLMLELPIKHPLRNTLKSFFNSNFRLYTEYPYNNIELSNGRRVIKIAQDYLEALQLFGEDYKRLEGLIEKATDPILKMNPREMEETAAVISSTAKKLGVTPSQLGQILFADRQVMTTEVDGGQPVLSSYETYASSIRATKQDEAMASSRLSAPPRMTNATDSPLYRLRSAEEATMVRPNLVVNEEVVMEALSTDAVSRRIMAKNVEVKEGQQVGVRLNLNVMKNTGVPVQTMHDKTASGEALKYAAAVTVKNPTLFVNQNARRKILTFQENKFPMASVNGEFLTDNLSQTDFSGVKAFFNPFKHNVFVDAAGRPIKSAEEATVIGSTVYLRGNIEYYDFSDPILMDGRMETPKQKEKRTERGEKYDKALKRFQGFSERMGVQFESREDLEDAYDNMPISSQVAMNESEVAANMEEAQERASARLKMRQTAGRSARVYTGDTRRQIVDNPNNYFTPQVIKELKRGLNQKSDAELIDVMTEDGLGRLSQRNDDLGVLAAAEMINRAVARGDMDAVPDLIEEAAAMGTTAGRILRHLRELRGSTPKGIETIILKAIERKGNTITDQQKTRLQKMASDLFRVGAEHEELMKRAIAGEDVEAELKAKTEELKAIERDLETFCNSTIERGWGELGGLLIQGNLLTPMSQITNVGANMVNALSKVAVDAIALPVERMVNMFGIDSPMKRNYSINAYMYGVRKFGTGFIEAIDQIMTGQEPDVGEWRMNRGFAPFRSLMASMGKGDLPMGADGKTNLNTRAKLFVQGTLGIPAEVMFRFLTLGDTPFRRYVEGIELYQIGKNQGLEGDALKNFIKFPDKKSMEMAMAEGKKLTYQEETVASRTADDFVKFVERITSRFFDWIPGTDGNAMARFLIRSNIPYRRTPANILYDTLTFATPYVAIPRMMAELKNGDARSASQTMAKAMIGGMATQVTLMMIREGIISGAIEWNEDEEKNMAYDQFPPNSINISALKRWMAGGEAAKQPDDYFVSYMKLGILGTVMGSVVKGVDKEELKKRDYSGDQWVTHVLQDSFGIQAFSSIAHMMDQSFVQGMNNLIQVLSTGDERTWENWLKTTFQAMSATALPNTMSAFYRAERDYLPDTRITKDMSFGERILKSFEYTIKSRTFGLGEVPIRRNWKGEPIEQTPRGTSGIAYQLFDITKARQGEADAVSNEIWRLYEQTERLTKACGTPGYAEKRKLNVPNIKAKHLKMLKEIDKSYTWMDDEEFMADAVYLNTEQINRMMEASGKERYMEVEAFMETEEYNAMDNEERIEALDDINDNYNSAIEISAGKFRNHTMVLFDIMQEIYDSER